MPIKIFKIYESAKVGEQLDLTNKQKSVDGTSEISVSAETLEDLFYKFSPQVQEALKKYVILK